MGVGVPVFGTVAVDTGLVVGQNRLIFRTDASPRGCVQHETRRTSDTPFFFRVPDTRRRTVDAVLLIVDVGKLGRTFTFFSYLVINCIKWASNGNLWGEHA